MRRKLRLFASYALLVIVTGCGGGGGGDDDGGGDPAIGECVLGSSEIGSCKIQ